MIGFWRSVLFQLLGQCPELVTWVFSQRSTAVEGMADAMEIREPELRLAFARFMELSNLGEYRFACFIVGLDDHQGDNLSHKNMATLLSSWGSQPHVKIICSSRPHNVLTDVFGDTGTVTAFQELTFGDILGFTEHKSKTELSTPLMPSAPCNYLELAGEIAKRAEGVVLWTTFVVGALINQYLDHDDSKEALGLRLEECPDSLEALFQQMLNKVDKAPSVQWRSNMALYLASHDPFENPFNALVYVFVADRTRLVPRPEFFRIFVD